MTRLQHTANGTASTAAASGKVRRLLCTCKPGSGRGGASARVRADRGAPSRIDQMVVNRVAEKPSRALTRSRDSPVGHRVRRTRTGRLISTGPLSRLSVACDRTKQESPNETSMALCRSPTRLHAWSGGVELPRTSQEVADRGPGRGVADQATARRCGARPWRSALRHGARTLVPGRRLQRGMWPQSR